MTISNGEMKNVEKVVKFLEESGLLIKGANKTNENEAKEQTGRFFVMLLGTLAATLLGSIIVGKGMHPGDGVIKDDEGKIRVEQNF